MNDKTKIWKFDDNTRLEFTTNDARAAKENIERTAGRRLSNVSVQEKWSYAGTENGEAFKVDIDNGAVTVNGRHYDSLDDVPRAERERIGRCATARRHEGLWDMLKNAGVQIEDSAGDHVARTGKPAFTIETDNSSAPDISQTHRRAYEPPKLRRKCRQPRPPGPFPKSGGLRALMIGIAVGLAALAQR